jgi:hypothetical protein
LTYDWREDALDCYHLALHMLALKVGSKQFRTLPEMYWVERNGGIP